MVASSLIAFIWAFCEATFFFIVPDVWLTWLVISKSDYKELSRAVFCATLGAIVGGIVVYQAGRFLSYSIYFFHFAKIGY
jgi:membrane protein YqaA with SNARE-associated domain